MVRSMSHAAQPFFYLPVPRASRPARPRMAVWMLAAGIALIAGCASKPPGIDGRSVASPGRFPDRDGAPSDAPPDLARLPDAVPQIEPIRPGGANKPYSVLGQSYEPMAKDVAWKETGLASWYGTKFHGRRTASGEMFSMYGLTAAHRTLPIPSYARVRNTRSGKEIIVRINDRGPFHSTRIIDLSYAAAVKLGIVSMGSAQVEIERLTFDDIRTGAWKRGTSPDPEAGEAVAGGVVPASPGGGGASADVLLASSSESVAVPAVSLPDATVPASASASPAVKIGAPAQAQTPAAKGFWVQLAALGRRDGVDRLQQKAAAVMADLAPMLAIFKEASFFKLQVGPYASRGEALAAAEQARQALQLTPMVFERR